MPILAAGIFQNFTWWIILDAFFVFALAAFIIKFIVKERYLIEATLFLFLISIIFVFGWIFPDQLAMTRQMYLGALIVGAVVIIFISAPTIRRSIEDYWKVGRRKSLDVISMGSDKTQGEILKATKQLSKTKTGALITIEKHQKLDRYAQKAITLNADVSAELLINIFTPNTPLHDGAVIIRGDKIMCAAAYYELSSQDQSEKTTGSRHRAASGIAESTDSLTIVVSEQTGQVSVAIGGVRLPQTEDSLKEYLTNFMRGAV